MARIDRTVRSKIQQLAEEARWRVRQKGFRLEAGDWADWLQTYSPQAARSLLTGALNFTRPLTRGLGLQVTKFTKEQIEIVIPAATLQASSSQEFDDVIVHATARQALHLLWEKEIGAFAIHVHRFEGEIQSLPKGELCCRFELLEKERQMHEAQASASGQVPEITSTISVLDQKGRRVGIIHLSYSLEQHHQQRLNKPH